jgi:stage V sporulation protein R
MKATTHEYVKEVERYNQVSRENTEQAEHTFFAEIIQKNPEFESMYDKYRVEKKTGKIDLMRHIMEYSEFLKKDENRWMKSVIEVIHDTSLFFQPQIRTKIMNEGWASYWHERLFLADERILGHEVEYARVNSGVTVMPRVGLNPYALGMRLFQHIEELADKGKISYKYQRLKDTKARKDFDEKTGTGQEFIFQVRENFSDFLFINTFLDQDFVDKNQLFVVGKRLNPERMVWEYYVKSRKAEDYRQMVLDSLYHPPHIEVDASKSGDGTLYLVHEFEGKPLYKDFIPNTMMGIEYLWGKPVKLETSDVEEKTVMGKKETQVKRVLYTMENRKITKKNL